MLFSAIGNVEPAAQLFNRLDGLARVQVDAGGVVKIMATAGGSSGRFQRLAPMSAWYRAWLQRLDASASVAAHPYAMTAAKAAALSAAKDLLLVRAKNAAGFRHVVCCHNAYRAQVRYKDENHNLGCFHTPE